MNLINLFQEFIRPLAKKSNLYFQRNFERTRFQGIQTLQIARQKAAQCYEHHVMPISVTKNILKPISKVQADAFITENNYKPLGKYSNNQQRNRSFHKSNVASNDQLLNRKFDSKRYTPNSCQICLGFNRYSKPFLHTVKYQV